MAEGTCLYCDNLRGCPLLSDEHGNLILERVIMEETPNECERWTQLTPRQKNVRVQVYERCGLGAVRAIHTLPRTDQHTQALEESEAEELQMKEDTPDFAAMLWEGMTTTDRRQQLEFDTDESGEFIVEEDNEGNPRMRPRPEYQLRQFACDPDKHIGLDLRTGMFWNTGKVIDFILKSEVEQELIIKDKKAKKANKEETDMGKRVVLNRGKKPGAAAGGAKKGTVPSKVGGGGGKVARPPQKGAPKPSGKKPGPRPAGKKPGPRPTAAPPAAAPDFDLDGVVQAVASAVLPAIEEAKNEILAAISEARANNNDLNAIIHDRLCQTNGTMSAHLTDDEGNLLYIDENGEATYDEEGNEPYMETFDPVYHVEGQLMSASPDFEGYAEGEGEPEGGEE